MQFYGLGLMNSTLIQTVLVGNTTSSSMDGLRAGALGALYIVLIALPGYWVAILLIDRVGRWWLQFIGFAAQFCLFLTLGGLYNIMHDAGTAGGAGFIVMYGLTFFFANAGVSGGYSRSIVFVVSSLDLCVHVCAHVLLHEYTNILVHRCFRFFAAQYHHLCYTSGGVSHACKVHGARDISSDGKTR